MQTPAGEAAGRAARVALRLERKTPMRRAAAIALAVLLALPTAELRSAPSTGTISGIVRLEGRPVSGVTVAFIELQSGAVVRAVSREDGGFETTAPPGEYAVTTESQAGLTVGQAPVRVAVADGGAATADVELVAVPSAVMQDAAIPVPAAPGAPAAAAPAMPEAAPAAAANLQAPPAESQAPATPTASGFVETTGKGAKIEFEPVTCFVAGEFPLLDASIQPIASVARARVYFKGAGGQAYYYVEMGAEEGRYFGKLPRPRVEASPITYYLQSTTTDFEESQTREVDAVVVADKAACGDRKIAAFGPPGPVTVFSAATGASVSPAGFAAAASGIALGIIAVIAAGAAAAGVVGGVVVGPGAGGATPAPIAPPSPIPVPTPVVPPTLAPITVAQ